jgi:putative glutamine amidotransferase
MRPRVLVTANRLADAGRARHQVRESHLSALREAGLSPLIAAGPSEPELRDLLDLCAAAYLPGGDYVPETRDEPEPESARKADLAGLAWDPEKVRVDLLVLREAWARRLPLLAVCGGCQAMVLFAGGTLRRCRPEELARHSGGEHVEEIAVRGGTLAESVLGRSTTTNSFHRQAIASVPEPLAASAESSDGIVEAVEARAELHRFWLGLQWHPERLGDARPYRALRSAADGWGPASRP